jgi:hypothetical protein
MLLELFQHHQELFLAAIEPLIRRRDCRSLGAMAATCKILHAYIVQLDFYQHYINNKCMLKAARICKAIFDDGNSLISIIMYNNKITYYAITHNQPRLLRAHLNCYRGTKWDFWFMPIGFQPTLHNIDYNVVPKWILDSINKNLIYDKKSTVYTDTLIDSSQIYP